LQKRYFGISTPNHWRNFWVPTASSVMTVGNGAAAPPGDEDGAWTVDGYS
jgi:hypothetical protein